MIKEADTIQELNVNMVIHISGVSFNQLFHLWSMTQTQIWLRNKTTRRSEVRLKSALLNDKLTTFPCGVDNWQLCVPPIVSVKPRQVDVNAAAANADVAFQPIQRN